MPRVLGAAVGAELGAAVVGANDTVGYSVGAGVVVGANDAVGYGVGGGSRTFFRETNGQDDNEDEKDDTATNVQPHIGHRRRVPL